MIDYQNTKIFYLQTKTTVVFGATTMTLPQRKTTFKTECEQGRLKNEQLKGCLIESGFNLHLYKVVSCKSKRELNKQVRRCKREFFKDKKNNGVFVLSLTD